MSVWEPLQDESQSSVSHLSVVPGLVPAVGGRTWIPAAADRTSAHLFREMAGPPGVATVSYRTVGLVPPARGGEQPSQARVLSVSETTVHVTAAQQGG